MKMAKKEYECVIAHAYDADEVAAFRLLPEIIEKLNNGYNIPLDTSRANIKKKIDSKVLHFVGYDVVINGIEYVLKCMVKRDDKNKHGRMIEYPYSFKKKRTSE